MGIFYFIYFLLFSGVNVIKICWNGDIRISELNKSRKLKFQYELYKNSFLVKKTKINFFKKKNGLKFFYKTNRVNFSLFLRAANVNNTKNFFFFIFLICSFFSASNLQNLIFAFSLNKSQLSKFILSFIQLFMVLCSVSSNLHKVFFINFFKFTDFFFKRKNIFFFGLKPVKVYASLFSTPVDNAVNYQDGGFCLSDISKFQIKNPLEKSLAPSEAQSYLFLFNSFFSANKKFFFLRNNEIFNKSRYSRNRQTYRTGVFWCIWLTVLTVIGLYFYFYVFLIKFTYAWFFFFLFILSFFFYYFRSKIEKHFFF